MTAYDDWLEEPYQQFYAQDDEQDERPEPDEPDNYPEDKELID